MAEGAFRRTVHKAGYAGKFRKIDSCGTAGYHAGNHADPREHFPARYPSSLASPPLLESNETLQARCRFSPRTRSASTTLPARSRPATLPTLTSS